LSQQNTLMVFCLRSQNQGHRFHQGRDIALFFFTLFYFFRSTSRSIQFVIEL
jgi:hypothetical protein